MRPTDAEVTRLAAAAREICDEAAALARALDYTERTGADPRPRLAEWSRRAGALADLASDHDETLDSLEEERAELRQDAEDAAALHPSDD